MLGHSIVSQHFMEPEDSIPNSQELSTCSYPEPAQSSPHYPIPPLQDPASSYPPATVLVYLVGSLARAFPPITQTRSSSPPFVLHDPPSHPPRLYYSNYTYLAKSTNHEAPHYAIFSILPSPHPSPNILLSTLSSNTLSLCSSLNVRDQVSHPYRTTAKL
jgi:hypothetical protein